MNVKKIESLQNPLIKHLIKLHQNRDYRYEHGLVVIEGKKIVEEVCRTTPAIRLIIREGIDLPNIQANEINIVPASIIKKISGTVHSEGIFAEVKMPQFVCLSNFDKIIVLDEINDPGNLGTLLRTAVALGWQGAFILKNSCDPFNDKALRAAKGATFRLPLAFGNWSDLIKLQEKQKWQCLSADLNGITPSAIPNAQKRLLILGNEAQGLSSEAKSLGQAVTIPMQGNTESLNVSIAGAILMYLLADVGGQ